MWNAMWHERTLKSSESLDSDSGYAAEEIGGDGPVGY